MSKRLIATQPYVFEEIDVLATFGASGNDLTNGCRQAMLYAGQKRRDTGGGVFNGTVKLKFPSGDWIVREPLMQDGDFPGVSTFGLVLEGNGQGITNLIYTPDVAGTPFIKNTQVLGFRIEKMQFTGTDATADFMWSDREAAAPQNYGFTDVAWSGAWNNLFKLTGVNNNSEFRWYMCTFAAFAQVGAILYTPLRGSGGSDQFLNYWFHGCDFLGPNTIIDMASGGNIDFHACDISGFFPDTEKYLFYLRDNNHFFGVCNFNANGLRVELASAGAKLLYSEWGSYGNVRFAGLDCSSQAFQAWADTTIPVLIAYGNNPGAAYTFDNFLYMGKFQTDVAIADFETEKMIEFRNGQFLNVATFADAFISNSTAPNFASVPIYRIRGCRCSSANGVALAPDTDINYQIRNGGYTEVKGMGFRQVNGALPIDGQPVTITLPLNAKIEGIIFRFPNGHVVTDGHDATATVTAGDGTILAKTPVMSPYRNGLELKGALAWYPLGALGAFESKFLCDTNEKTNLTLTIDGPNEYSGGGDVEVQYRG